VIQVQNLTKEYGDFRAVDNLSFEVYEGEILGFLGPNGAGKTTTMRILTCFFPPTAGTARIAGFNVIEEPDSVRRVIGYMPEGVPLYRDMTVCSALDFVAHSKGYRSAARKRYVDEAIEETGLGNVRNRLIGHLSKGYRQRVGLAQAIIGEPKVLILDEPTASLDPRQISEVRALIKSMAGRRTVILSTHILPEVQMTCSRVVIINQGRIAASGTAQKLTTQMQSGFQTNVRIIGPVELVADALRGLEGVERVQTSAPNDEAAQMGAMDFEIITQREPAVLHPLIAQTVVQRAWQLVSMQNVGLTLEEVFLKVVAGETESSGAEDKPTV
jgi:ABC-2 type transport system ATP-binding protein